MNKCDDRSIVVGSCYAVLLNGNQSFVKIRRQITPNCQGEPGPAKWIGERVGVVDEPDKEGKEVEVGLDDLIGLAKRRDMCVQAIRQGWRTDKEIQEYLQICGVEISISTVACYKSQFHKGKLFKPQKKQPEVKTVLPQLCEGTNSVDVTLEIFRLAKKVGGLKSLGHTVETLCQAVESLQLRSQPNGDCHAHNGEVDRRACV